MSQLPHCPTGSAHRRLLDCHAHWHDLAESYMDPEDFRLHLNALIQNLRNVTWLLQKRRGELPNFDVWYSAWQADARQDPVLKWLVDARNRVVKESDLALHSEAAVRLADGWSETEMILRCPPSLSTHQILSGLATVAASLVDGKVVTVERRWVENELPEWELLDAAAHIYGRLVHVISLAHHAAGVQECDQPCRSRTCVVADLEPHPHCMMSVDSARRLHVNMDSMTQMVEGITLITSDETMLVKAQERYGTPSIQGDAVDRVPDVMELASRILKADKWLSTTCWLLKDDMTVDLISVEFPDHESKSVQMHRIADRVERVGANGIVFVGEMWMAPLHPEAETSEESSIGHLRASERDDRQEAILVVGAASDGRISESVRVFSRSADGDINLEPAVATHGPPVGILGPVLMHWSRLNGDTGVTE